MSLLLALAASGGVSQSSRFDAGDTFFSAQANLSLGQGASFDDPATFYGPAVKVTLAQSARFDASDAFYAATIERVGYLEQASRFNDEPLFPAQPSTGNVAAIHAIFPFVTTRRVMRQGSTPSFWKRRDGVAGGL